ncbi:tetraspanin-2A isoform X1 [Procambarus clarkii]|uniref:tetraspanin-2A isoform X1 n=2 Tax=Procambarus clarkii TaxID=6728 RepID=UPI001E67902B|nr:tetraspanin-2A-like isoform X1 [Procambarus clarkii]
MARGKGSGAMEEHLELLQYLLYIFNSVFFLAASAVFAMTLWVRFENNMNNYMEGLSMYTYWNITVALMVSAILVMMTSFLACCGAYFRSKCLLGTYMTMTVVTFLLLLGESAFMLNHGLEDSLLFPYIQDTMKSLIHQYQWDTAAKRAVDIVQEYIGCCGGYSADDYTNIHMPIPDTCRDQVTGNQYKYSCAEVFSQYLEIRTGWITGLSLSICFFQFFSMAFSIYTWQAINEMESSK